MVQITEKVLKKSLQDKKNLWFIKIQNIHTTTTPADFIIIGKYRYLIECKEISVFKGYKSFIFDRLTQEKDLINFQQKNNNNYSFILLNFREKTLKKSHIFLIPINNYIFLKKSFSKKSINLNEVIVHFNQFKMDILPESKLNLATYIV